MSIKQLKSSFPLICVFITFLFFIRYHHGHAQSFADRFSADISVYSTFGSEKEQSFWLTRNRFDIFDQESGNGLTILSGKLETNPERIFDLGGKLDVVARASADEKIFLQEAYIEARAGYISIIAGRKNNLLGHPYENLSTGSMVMSRNVRPMPRISISVPEFEEIPLTRGWLEYKGHFAHGWFDDERYVDNPYIHDKSVYIRTGADTGFSFYVGVVHLAIWGGTSPVHDELPDNFNDFLRVVTIRAGDEDSPSNERNNKLGFHTGTYDSGFMIPIKETDLHFYYQHLFTDGSGQRFRNLGDGLFGLLLKNPFPQRWITSVLFEYSDTRKQSGPGMSDKREGDWPWFCEERNCGERYGARDNYFNNSIYRSGLSYQGNSMGSPFFLTTADLSRIDPEANPYSTQLFASNRNLSYHLGVEGFFSKEVGYRFLSSYVRYFGTYAGLNLGTYWGSRNPELNQEDYFFNPSRNQWYFMLETHWQPAQMENIRFTATLAADHGHLYNNVGMLLGINWKLK
ncbi:MAG: capsule assembly Wzi family protein [Bacteroidota bacterium]